MALSYGMLIPERNEPSKSISGAAFGMALKRMGLESRYVPLGTRHVEATA